jgi:hypothetical protein
MTRSKSFLTTILAVAGLVLGAVLYWKLQNPLSRGPENVPAKDRMVGGYDVLGTWIPPDRARELLQTDSGRQQLSPAAGAVEVTPAMIDAGRKEFYEQTFDNEHFLTDVLGALDGPINLKTLTAAIADLKGQFTTDLVVKCDRDATIGGRRFVKGELLHTGLDVQAGAAQPLGIVIRLHDGRPMVGVTCAACHATLDSKTGKVIEGAPNNDLQAGLVLALASNSAAMFRNSGTNPQSMPKTGSQYKDGTSTARLPDPKQLEDAVDADFLAWPPGSFDSTIDMTSNPSQIPSSFTFDAWPYGWSGFASVGWFHGLTTLNSNVHAVNSDATTGAASSQKLLGIDSDTFLGILLQNASSKKMRLPQRARPTDFFNQIDPTPGEPGMNSVFRMPGFPNGSIFITDGLMVGTRGHRFGEELNALSAFQDSLVPPRFELKNDLLRHGRDVVMRAGCLACHSGATFTNHAVIPAAEIGTEPSRAQALKAMPSAFVPPKTYTPDQTFPVPNGAPTLDVPEDITPEQTRRLAYAQDGAGGYKVQSLVGLAYDAPYLHDGGVAAGSGGVVKDDSGCYEIKDVSQLGWTGLMLQNIAPDARASLFALIDRDIRTGIISGNSDPRLKRSHVSGRGHNFWIDRQAGFSCLDQNSAVEFLLSIGTR